MRYGQLENGYRDGVDPTQAIDGSAAPSARHLVSVGSCWLPRASEREHGGSRGRKRLYSRRLSPPTIGETPLVFLSSLDKLRPFA